MSKRFSTLYLLNSQGVLLKEFMEPTVVVGGCLEDHRQKKNPVLVICFLSGNMTCDCVYVHHLLHLL